MEGHAHWTTTPVSPLMSKRQDHSPLRDGDVRDWQQTGMDRKRWSTWTADTSITALESGSEDSFTRHARKDSSDDAITLLSDKAMAARDPSPSIQPAQLPDDDGTEDSLNAALASMLSTANSLLISTMTARSDLAKMQAIEAILDAEMDRREESVLREIENNEKMIKWMEGASAKLDRLLAESAPSSSKSMAMAAMTTGGRPAMTSLSSSTMARAVVGGSGGDTGASMSRHWRAPSTTSQVHGLDAASSSLGIFEAKDEDATISKSAARRLEKVLLRASSNGAMNAGPSTSHSRVNSEVNAVSMTTPPRPTAHSSKSSLAMRFNSAPQAPPPASSGLSLSPWSETSPSRQSTPSITSESGPSSVMSSRDGERDRGEEQGAAGGPNSSSAVPINAFLTPPTPCEDLPSVGGEGGHLRKRSSSHLRSPHPAVMAARHTSHGSPVSESAHGQMSFEDGGLHSSAQAKSSNGSHGGGGSTVSGKGALEALRKLNGGSSGSTGGSSPGLTAPPGWGGTFASWVGYPNQRPE